MRPTIVSELKIYVEPEGAAFASVEIVEEACTGCNRCVDACQVDVFLPRTEQGEPPIVMYPGECWHCGDCVDVCPERCLKMVSLERIEGTPDLEALVVARFGRPLDGFPHDLGTAMIKDEMKCIRCGLCAKRCPTGAITMEALSFVEEYV